MNNPCLLLAPCPSVHSRVCRSLQCFFLFFVRASAFDQCLREHDTVRCFAFRCSLSGVKYIDFGEQFCQRMCDCRTYAAFRKPNTSFKMARKSSTMNSASKVAGTFVVICIAMCNTESTETWTGSGQVESDVESSIASGFRTLEMIRRQIIDSRNGRDLAATEEPGTSSYPRYAGPATLEERRFPVRSPGGRHLRRQADLAMYEALSKIAKVQIADPRIDHSTGSGNNEGNGRRASLPRFHDPVDDGTSKRIYSNFGPTRNLKNGGRTGPTASIVNSGRLPVVQRKFHCRPVRDIYIPKVEKRMPAYLCTLGNRAFVISSERFLKDTRDHFEVSLDEGTFRRLKPLAPESPALTSGVSVLPATLVLKPGENGYTVRGSSEHRQTPTAADEI